MRDYEPKKKETVRLDLSYLAPLLFSQAITEKGGQKDG